MEALFARIIQLEIHNKKLRRKIARQSILNKTGSKNLLNELSIKIDDGSGNGLMTTQEDLLGATGTKEEFENSYLLTEMDSVTNRVESPTNATSEVLNTSQGTMRKKKALKTEALKQSEKLIRE